jgi:hypothetical protein
MTEREGALLRFLDDSLLRYDLTTDAALSTGDGPPLGGHSGVVLAGDARWITPELRGKLRRYVRSGGHVWSLGVDALRRTVRLDGGTLSTPSAPGATDALGARPRQPLVRADVPGGATITVFDDGELGLFEGTSGSFAGYDEYEALASLAPPLVLEGAAGPDPDTPVIAGWRLGDGVAIHTGLPQLPARARDGDLDAAALVRGLWSRLAGG